MGKSGKASGIRAAATLIEKRKRTRWADYRYKKSHSGTAIKANPFAGASHAKGIVLEKMYVVSHHAVVDLTCMAIVVLKKSSFPPPPINHTFYQ